MTVLDTRVSAPGVGRPPLTSPRGEPVTIVHLTAECVPFARTGGLAEAVRGLADYQAATGAPVVLIMPLHRTVRDAVPDLEPVGPPFPVPIGPRVEEARLFRVPRASPGLQIYFVEHAEYFNRPGLYGKGGLDYPDNAIRYAFFSLAAVTALPDVVETPAVLHAHDWHTALAPVYLRTHFGDTSFAQDVVSVVSVHNAGYQGHFPPAVIPDIGLPWHLYNFQQLEWYGQVNFLKGGLAFADLVTTVSPTHADELRTPAGGFGLHDSFQALGPRFVGILNGIDQAIWDPATDPQITARYSSADVEPKRRCKAALQRSYGLPQRRRTPLLAFTGRLVVQKGLDLILSSPELFELDAQFVFLGAGDPHYERALVDLAAAAPNRVGVQLDFTDRLEHRLMAGADAFLMPSQYEPCGLTQMRAQRYGALPIGRRVGGLVDTIDDGDTGFLFDAYEPAAFQAAVFRALDTYADPTTWGGMMHRAMARDFAWQRSVVQYFEVYRAVGYGLGARG